MNKLDSQVIRNMQADDRAYGEASEKRIVHKDKSQKHRQQFNRMSVKDLVNMNEDEDYDYEDEYETN